MRLFMHNHTITPGMVTQVIQQDEKVIIKKTYISEKGIHTPVTGLLKIGTKYPTPNGRLPILSVGEIGGYGFMSF